MGSVIDVVDVTFGYETTPVLEEVSLRVIQGDFILLIGPNGGGKTTLLKLVLGILTPWSGTIRFSGDTRKRLGYVPQFAHFNRNFPISVFDMVLSGCIDATNYRRRYTADDRQKTQETMARLGLAGKEGENITSLSGGQLQRALIARALVADPLLLLLDEPTTSMDVTSQGYLIDLLAELRARMGIVVVTHDPTPYAQEYRHIACLNRKLYYHERGELDSQTMEKVYGCPVEILGHGIPHTLLSRHCGEEHLP